MKYFTMEKENMVNGPGLRTVVWVSGCEHHCPNCHNPETWDKDSELAKEWSKEAEKELFKSIKPDYISGVTFSGGDPLAPYNRVGVLRIIKKIRHKFGDKKSIWVYTGYTFEEVSGIAGLDNIDVLVDGEFKEQYKSRDIMWRGSTNQRLIDVKTSLLAGMVMELKDKDVQ